MRYETQEDRERENKAIEKFVSLFKGSYKKLGHSDIDFRVFDKDKKIIAKRIGADKVAEVIDSFEKR